MPPNIQELQKAIKETHGCDSYWLRSTPVVERFEGERASGGGGTTVEIFALAGHRKASIAYVWSYREGNQTKILTVLGLHPVDSAQAAVKAAIASKARQVTG